MNINIRTKDDLGTLLATGQSGNWKVSQKKETKLTQNSQYNVRIFNWEGTQVLIGDYNPDRSFRSADGRLVIGIDNTVIVPCQMRWFKSYGRSPFVYSGTLGVQNKMGKKVGVVRNVPLSANKQKLIDDFFKQLINEIKLLGVNKIVFRAGGNIPIPDFFREWCHQNGVEIEVLENSECVRIYPEHEDIKLIDIMQ